ncbi:hypothetical protein BpHYR1_036204 [Brachionus plicatilis]|uniref:Uncharacterized protein n=1 Tax=Brachionus plicatilis TaxID=10195 RepID=A0A3M7RJT9_BRAPC|nr:hypothetical protein BpHYR1_036204 [Brachionus plicatilis]
MFSRFQSYDILEGLAFKILHSTFTVWFMPTFSTKKVQKKVIFFQRSHFDYLMLLKKFMKIVKNCLQIDKTIVFHFKILVCIKHEKLHV